MVKKVILNIDSSKASGPDSIPVVVLRNRDPKLSYIQAELFKMCLKKSCFPDCWKASSAVPVFKNVGERSAAKNFSTVIKVPVGLNTNLPSVLTTRHHQLCRNSHQVN